MNNEPEPSLSPSRKELKPLPTDENNPLADDADHDDLIMWLAYKEAKGLLATEKIANEDDKALINEEETAAESSPEGE